MGDIAGNYSLYLYFACLRACDNFTLWPHRDCAVLHIQFAFDLSVNKYIPAAVDAASDDHSLSDNQRDLTLVTLL